MAKKAPPRRRRGYASGGEVDDTDYGKVPVAQISDDSLGNSIMGGFKAVAGMGGGGGGGGMMGMNKGGKVRKIMKKGVRRGR